MRYREDEWKSDFWFWLGQNRILRPETDFCVFEQARLATGRTTSRPNKAKRWMKSSKLNWKEPDWEPNSTTKSTVSRKEGGRRLGGCFPSLSWVRTSPDVSFSSFRPSSGWILRRNAVWETQLRAHSPLISWNHRKGKSVICFVFLQVTTVQVPDI